MKKISVIILFSILALVNTITAQTKAQEAMDKFNTMLSIISQVYVDSVNEMQLTDEAIIKMLGELDPHSVYIPKKDKKKMNEALQGKFQGVGIQFNLMNDTILVVSPIAGGPSEKLGILAGDKIITIDGDTVAGVGFTNDDVVKNLRGPKGTHVLVGIKRHGIEELLDFDIKRDDIPIYSVNEGYMVDKKTGYIGVTRFAQKTTEEFRTELHKLQKMGMKNLILDLRGNSGGYLFQAIQLSDEFLEKDRLIVYTKGRAFPKEDTYATNKGDFEKGKLVVLIDEGSASASEIVSGAIQDWDRGIVIGRRSFGKGLVQKQFPLPDGSQVRLTTNRYYTPSGRSIQRPYGNGTDAYYKDLRNRFKDGELTNKDSINFPDSLKFETRLNKRTVYGGGGIMPDIFVPLDTSERSVYYVNLFRKGIFNRFTLKYLDANRAQLLGKYPTKYEYADNFKISEEFLKEFTYFASENKVEMNEEQFNKSKRQIENVLKGYIARSLFNTGAYMQIINSIDPTFMQAMKAINSNKFDKLEVKYK